MAKVSNLQPYIPLPAPVIEGGDAVYLQRELANIQASIASLLVVAPQAATQAPTTLIDGMVRIARSPWRPISGVSTDAWVFYDAPSNTWKLLHSN